MKQGFHSLMALIGLSSILGPGAAAAEARKITPTPRPRRREKIGGSTFGHRRSSHTPHHGGTDMARLAKREEMDARACRLNYRGWSGFEDAGDALLYPGWRY